MNKENSETLNAAIFLGSIVLIGVACIVGLILFFGSWYIVPFGHRGVLLTLGKADVQFKREGFGLKLPIIQKVEPVSIRQISHEFTAECYSQDLQQLSVIVRVLFRLPETKVVELFVNYPDVYSQVILPKTHEALKEITALRTAEQVVKTREEIKTIALDNLRKKLNGIVNIEDIVLVNIDLSEELERAIEQKMVQEQEAGRAKFSQQQSKTEAETAKIRAQGEADAIRIRSEALQQNQKIVDLMIVEKWNGVSPLVVGNGGNFILPLSK
jgi:prohibitin 2